MFKCNGCGYTFSNPITYVEPHGEEVLCSPCCNDVYEEVKECENCGEIISIDEKYCDVCKNNIINRFKALIRNNFYVEELEYINEYYDGETIE